MSADVQDHGATLPPKYDENSKFKTSNLSELIIQELHAGQLQK